MGTSCTIWKTRAAAGWGGRASSSALRALDPPETVERTQPTGVIGSAGGIDLFAELLQNLPNLIPAQG